MKSSFELWRLRRFFKLSEAALLITGNNPDDWSDEKLLSTPPAGFKAIYGAILEDAVTVVDAAAESQEVSGEYYIEYALQTNKSKTVSSLSDSDGLQIKVERHELIRWISANGINATFFCDDTLTELANVAIDKPLSTRERRTFLVIIAALAQLAKLDLTQTSKAGVIISHLVDQLGATIGPETIANKLKELPEALERRTK